MKKKLFLLFTVVSVIAMMFIACSTQAPSPTAAPTAVEAEPVAEEPAAEASAEVIKVGFLTPLTGQNATYGGQVLQAARMITDIINEPNPNLHLALAKDAGLPNLNGAKIELVVADHKGDPAVAVAEAKRLITEAGVVAVTG